MPLLPGLVSYVGIKLGARFTKAVLSKSIVLSEQEHYSINAIFEHVVSDECNAFLVLCTISKTRASVSSGYPNTEKQMKARGRRPSAFIVSRCLDTPMKHEARVLEITSHDHSQTNHKQRLLIRIVCYLTFLHG